MLTMAAQRPPRGRPAKPPDVRLSEVVSIRITAHDADALYRLATKRGQPLDAILRAVLRRLIAATA